METGRWGHGGARGVLARAGRAVTRRGQSASLEWPRAFSIFSAKVLILVRHAAQMSLCTVYGRRAWSNLAYRGHGGPVPPQEGKEMA